MKFLALAGLLFLVACQSSPKREAQSLPPASEVKNSIRGNEYVDLVHDTTCFEGENLHFATNQKIWLGDKNYPMDTYLNVYKEDNTLKVVVNLPDDSGSEKDAFGSYDYFELPTSALSCNQVTSIPLIKNPETGEFELGDYSLPIDFKFAVTTCYRQVKARVRNRITLTGRSAYMANSQLEDAGWRRYTSIDKAPKGAICVFGAGGKRTSSGGHKHGHIGIKGASGLIDPYAGVRLNRPFLGCYTEPRAGRRVIQRNSRGGRGEAPILPTHSCQRTGKQYRCTGIPFGSRRRHNCERINKPNTKYHRQWTCESNPYEK